jgi:DNA replication protein DnaC
MGFSSLYIRLSRLFQDLSIATADGSYPCIMKKLAEAKVLIIDDLGLTPLSPSVRRDLLEVVENRRGLSSTVVVTQLPIDRWHDNVKEGTIADAILDRLVRNAHKINLKGDSMRKLRSTYKE